MTFIADRGTARTFWVALRALLLLITLTIVYSVVLTGLGVLVAPAQAHGSPVTAGRTTVGSALIGQSFTTKKGAALPQWFQSRPSAAGGGYDGGASSASNLGPDDPGLLRAISDRRAAIEQLDGVNAVPADAVTASGSGLDPHISPDYARLQVDTVATARHLDPARVRALVERFVQAPDLGYLGQPTVNVLRLNTALAALDPAGNKD